MEHPEDSQLQTTDGFPSSLVSRFKGVAKGWVPNIVPLITIFAALPYLLFLSLIAGWLIWSRVPTGWSAPIYLRYGEDTSPHAFTEVAGLAPTQTYEIALKLVVPTNEANYGLGNFMTSVTFYSTSNKTIASFERPSLVLPQKTGLIAYVHDTRLQTLTIPLSTSFIPGFSRVSAHVIVGRRDGWKSTTGGVVRDLNVYEASIEGIVKPIGLQRVLYRFPLTVSMLASAIFFFVSSLTLLSCLLPSVFRGLVKDIEPESEHKPEAIDIKETKEEDEGKIRPMTTIRRISSRRQEEAEDEDADTNPTVDIRRRTRRGSVKEEEE